MSWILGLILALGLFLRVGLLDKTPPELFGDEIDVGYQAYSLLSTGRDLYGQKLPTYIHSLSEWRAPLLMYATVPTIAVFGNTEWGVRLPQVIFGSLAPLILFLLVYQTTKSKSISFLSSASLSVMPWHIYYSRAAFEVVIMLDLIMLATLLFFKKRFALCLLTFALSMYTYSTAVLFVPIWIAFLFFTSVSRPKWPAFLFLGFLLTPLTVNIVGGQAGSRFGLLNVFNSADTTRIINALRARDESLVSRLLHNRPETYFRLLAQNYLRAFSFEFLFVRGDPVYRHSIQVIGQLLPFTAPFLILGLWYLANKDQRFWFFWLITAPLPAILTSDGGYHATRLFLMVPPLAVGIGAGFLKLWQIIPKFKYPVFLVISAVVFYQFLWVSHYYLAHYSSDSWRWWHVGYQPAMRELARLAPAYSRVFINNTYEPALVRFLFWTSYPPAKFHRQFTLDQPQANILPHHDGFSLDGKYFFGDFSPPAKKEGIANYLLPDSLYLVSQRDNVGGDWDWRRHPPVNVQVLFTSTNAYDQPILYLVTKK